MSRGALGAFGVAGALYLGASFSAVRAAQAPAEPTVWDGVYTNVQADRGAVLFSADCAECHGNKLEGGEGKALVGTPFMNRWRDETVGDLLAYIRKNMPFSDDNTKQGSLPVNTYVDILTFILKSNGFPAGMRDLSPTVGVAAKITTLGGSNELPDSTPARVVGCLEPREGMAWHIEKATRPVRASATGGTPDAQVALGTRRFELKFVLSNLTRMVGHRVAVTGILIGEGGVGGLNVNSVESVSDTCN